MNNLYKTADAISHLVKSKHEKDVIKNYKHAVKQGNYNLARILVDEFSDYALENLEGDVASLSIKLYDETMEVMELFN